jgi:ElaB/YqjD/DUF883 family membrane-anchored ribosome-binding protein
MMEHTGSMSGQARRLKDTAADAAERAQEAAARVTARASDYAQDAMERAGDTIEQMTGRPIEGWMDEMLRYIRSHPLQTAVAALALGYVVGKLVRRG